MICERCQIAFMPKRAMQKFCSPNCARANARSVYETKMRATEVERFWARVDRKGPSDCWEWTGAKLPKGYGQCNWRGQTTQTHRLAYALSNPQNIPGARLVLHTCDNPPCCNPQHLWLGTAKDNTADMMSKGRQKFISRRTHCPRGHEYSEENTLWVWQRRRTYLARRCKACQSDKFRTYHQKTRKTQLRKMRK